MVEHDRRFDLDADWLASLADVVEGDRGGERGTGSPGPAAAAAGGLTCLSIKTEHRGALTCLRPVPKSIDPPSLSYAVGGSLIILKVPTGSAEVPRGVRGKITDFSPSSRRTFLRKLNSIDQRKVKADRVGLLTLTYGKKFPSPAGAKIHLKAFLRKLERECGRVPLFWKLEPQRRGAPHFHLLLLTSSPGQLQQLATWSAHAWFEIAGAADPWHLKWHLGEVGNKPCLEPIRTWNGVRSYGAKYIGKCVDGSKLADWEHPGRWWGTRHFDDLPVCVRRVDLAQAKMKLARRLLRRWYEKQPTGRWRCEDPDNGRILRERLNASALQQLQALGYVCTSIRRRWKHSRGGMTIYAPHCVARSILTWLNEAFEVHDDDDPQQPDDFPEPVADLATQGEAAGP